MVYSQKPKPKLVVVPAHTEWVSRSGGTGTKTRYTSGSTLNYTLSGRPYETSYLIPHEVEVHYGPSRHKVYVEESSNQSEIDAWVAHRRDVENVTGLVPFSGAVAKSYVDSLALEFEPFRQAALENASLLMLGFNYSPEIDSAQVAKQFEYLSSATTRQEALERWNPALSPPSQKLAGDMDWVFNILYGRDIWHPRTNAALALSVTEKLNNYWQYSRKHRPRSADSQAVYGHALGRISSEWPLRVHQFEEKLEIPQAVVDIGSLPYARAQPSNQLNAHAQDADGARFRPKPSIAIAGTPSESPWVFRRFPGPRDIFVMPRLQIERFVAEILDGVADYESTINNPYPEFVDPATINNYPHPIRNPDFVSRDRSRFVERFTNASPSQERYLEYLDDVLDLFEPAMDAAKINASLLMAATGLNQVSSLMMKTMFTELTIPSQREALLKRWDHRIEPPSREVALEASWAFSVVRGRQNWRQIRSARSSLALTQMLASEYNNLKNFAPEATPDSKALFVKDVLGRLQKIKVVRSDHMFERDPALTMREALPIHQADINEVGKWNEAGALAQANRPDPFVLGNGKELLTAKWSWDIN